MPLAIPLGTPEPRRRRMLLDIGRQKDWFDYESENPPGFTDEQGVTHPVTTYSVVLLDGTLPVTLHAEEVEGFVYREALERDDVASIAWREGM